MKDEYLIRYELDTDDELPDHQLIGTQVRLLWMDRQNTAILSFGPTYQERITLQISAVVLAELAALTAHPKFFQALTAVRAAGEPPALAVEDVS